MIQLQALNYIIASNDMSFLSLYDKRFYFNYENEYNFIVNHVQKYKQVPDINTIVGTFPDFTPLTVKESVKYLGDRLSEEWMANETAEIINDQKLQALFATDAVKAKNELLTKLQGVQPPQRSLGVDIIKTAKDRYDILLDKLNNPDSYKFSTGLNELDILLNGGLRRGEEFLLIYARTNNAKTWIAEKLAVSVWEQKENVGFFSPEMSPTEIGYRFDTLFKNFDNHGITGADGNYNSDNYKKYVNTLSNKNRPVFSVVTPLDFPNKRVTVSELRRWITALDLKMIVIDGLAYLTNERADKSKNTTENLTDISEDLMTLSIELKIPIVAVLQANREGARDKDGDVNSESPELDTIRGSDGPSHNASRAISVYKAKDVVKLYLSKNRYGERGQHLYYQYDINTGTFTYTANPKDGISPDITNNPDAADPNAIYNDKTETF